MQKEKTLTTQHEGKGEIKDVIHDAMAALAENWGPQMVVEKNANILVRLTEALSKVDAL